MDWKAIRDEFETTDITLKALAEKHEVKLPTLKSRKRREEWQKDASSKPKDASQDATFKDAKKSDKPKKRSGNPRPVKQFTKRNSAAKTHGLFAKHLPEEAQELIEELEEFDGAEILWQQIKIQYAAIIRSQKIMWVADQHDTTKEAKKERSSMDSEEIEYEIQFAWDKQASFLTAQSRAMSELRGLIKQFLEASDDEDMRRLKVEKMQADITKAQAETKRIEQEQEKEQADANGVFILNDKEAMRKEMERRASRSREDDGHHGPD